MTRQQLESLKQLKKLLDPMLGENGRLEEGFLPAVEALTPDVIHALGIVILESKVDDVPATGWNTDAGLTHGIDAGGAALP